MTVMVMTLRVIVGVVGLLLLAAILWAAFGTGPLHGGFWSQVEVLSTLPWGVVTLMDLYIGFVLFAIIVFLTERSWIAALLWALPVFVLGNVWSAVWLALRLPALVRRLRSDVADH
jgi:hypothetical protein